MGTEVFPPQQGEALRELTRQRPDLHGVCASRWRLADLRTVLPWLRHYSLPGVCQALRRLKVKRKQGRTHIHSPDPDYLLKMSKIERACKLAQKYPARVNLLYGDEFSFYRQPIIGGSGVYYPVGISEEPVFELAHGYNTRHRASGTLDRHTGKVVWVEGRVVGVDALCEHLEKVRGAYPDRILFLVWDNWFVHRHAKVVSKAAELHIHLLWLPTYAPWANPIEKLWRWLKQKHIRNHHLAAEWEVLKQRVRDFLNSFADGSADLLRYVGLYPLPD